MDTDGRMRITAYLSRFLPVHDLAGDDDIFELGYTGSLFALQLVAFVEREFGITVDGEDLELEHLRTLDALDAFVTRKLSAPAPR
ncbi:acyl carrier protein [Streptomyces werraensis]|uniref:acyl carrier protein n=1 Tax=Streptomyces werraensis TaxID=68284 RepID=UPI003419BFA7